MGIPSKAATLVLLAAPVTLMSTTGAAQAQAGTIRQSIEQNEPAVRLTRRNAGSFSEALNALSAQARVVFVVEGKPFLKQGTRPGAPLETVVSRLPTRGAALSEVVAKIADAYDYAAERRGNVFLLRKRYAIAPQDVPSVTWEECLLATQDVVRAASRLNPRVPPAIGNGPDPLLHGLMASLTPWQLETMKQGLPLAQLSTQQQAQVWRYVLHGYVQRPLENVEGVLKQMEALDQPETAFFWKEIHGLRLFGYEARLGPKRVPFFIPLSHAGQVRARHTGVEYNLSHTGQGTLLPPPLDPTTPSAEDIEADGENAGSATLAEVIAALNAESGGAPKLTVDAALAAKGVTVVGAVAAPAQMMQALAALYGLHVVTEEDGTLRLTRRSYRIVTDVSALPETLRGIFPEPLLRAMYGGATREQSEAKQRGDPEIQVSSDSKEGLKAFVKASEADKGRTRGNEALRTAAVRRLRALVEPKVAAAADGRAPFSSLGQEERRLLAILWMVDCLKEVNRLVSYPAPSYITNFRGAILEGGVVPGRPGSRIGDGPLFSLSLRFQDSEGNPIAGGAATTVVPYRPR